jgi:hypothetical protein
LSSISTLALKLIIAFVVRYIILDNLDLFLFGKRYKSAAVSLLGGFAALGLLGLFD